jgi:hypothetical protein
LAFGGVWSSARFVDKPSPACFGQGCGWKRVRRDALTYRASCPGLLRAGLRLKRVRRDGLLSVPDMGPM